MLSGCILLFSISKSDIDMERVVLPVWQGSSTSFASGCIVTMHLLAVSSSICPFQEVCHVEDGDVVGIDNSIVSHTVARSTTGDLFGSLMIDSEVGCGGDAEIGRAKGIRIS